MEDVLKAASMVVLHDSAVLIVKRGKPPARGLWSIPGGRIEPGENPSQAALREVTEETGIEAAILGRLGLHTPKATDPKTGKSILIEVFYGALAAGPIKPRPNPVASDDAHAAKWVEISQLENYHLTDGTHQFILAAALLFAENRHPSADTVANE